MKSDFGAVLVMAAMFRGVARTMRSAAKSASATKSSSRSFASKPCSAPRLAQLPRLGCAQSLLPLHSAVATARMTSCLTSASRDCRALSQGNDLTLISFSLPDSETSSSEIPLIQFLGSLLLQAHNIHLLTQV